MEVGNFSIASKPPNIKLPELKISKLNGDVTNWQAFWEQFDSAIHLNGTPDNINKFNYLLQYLCEDAKSAIKGLSLTSSNYIETIYLLKQRYGNTQILVSAYSEKPILSLVIRSEYEIFWEYSLCVPSVLQRSRHPGNI